jgi:hypothetical protein
MSARVAVASEMAIVALSDLSVALPSMGDQESLVRELGPHIQAARVFYLITDDPISCRIELLVNETVPQGLSREFEPCGGEFGLELPTGRLAVHGWGGDGTPVVAGTVDVAPGRHSLSVLARRPIDGARHAEDMAALLGSDWTYMQRVNRVGLVGCLPFVLLLIALLARQWQWLWVVTSLLAVSWLPYMVLRQGRRYKSAARRASDHEQARPHYVLTVKPIDREARAGGFLRV